MNTSFSVECEDYHGLATTTAYVMDHMKGISGEQNTDRLLHSRPLRCCFDTGANYTSVSMEVARRLNSKLNETLTVISPNAIKDVDVYSIDILLPNDVLLIDVKANVVDNPVDVLIGMDIIGSGDFALTMRNGRYFLSFSCPHQFSIDLSEKCITRL